MLQRRERLTRYGRIECNLSSEMIQPIEFVGGVPFAQREVSEMKSESAILGIESRGMT